MSTPASLPYAFVAKIVAADGQHDALADLLAGAVALANEEVGTIVWFAVRTHADTFWIFDAFPDEAARDAHANGAIVAALMANQHLLGAAPEILAADALASKLPQSANARDDRAPPSRRQVATQRHAALPSGARPIGTRTGCRPRALSRRGVRRRGERRRCRAEP